MNKKYKTWNIVRSIVLILTIFYIFYQTFVKRHLNIIEINKFQKYTIAHTKSINRSAKGTDYIEFIYYIKNKKYNGDTFYENYIKVPNGRYFVKFSEKNPWKNYLLDRIPVPDSIISAPPEGWDELPIKIMKNRK
ncbi:MAG: hypothetical protein HC905_21580 [Bacteroidales bacterium]|nr:hypothetical protein [Bacteroidales bacterium]